MNLNAMAVGATTDAYEQQLRAYHSALRWNRRRAEEIVLVRDSVLSCSAQLASSFIADASHNPAQGSLSRAKRQRKPYQPGEEDEELLDILRSSATSVRPRVGPEALHSTRDMSLLERGQRLVASPQVARNSVSSRRSGAGVSFQLHPPLGSSSSAFWRSSVVRRLSDEFEGLSGAGDGEAESGFEELGVEGHDASSLLVETRAARRVLTSSEQVLLVSKVRAAL